MRRDVLEFVLLGVGVGLAVFAVQAFTLPGSQLRWLAVLAAAALLIGLDVLLMRRRRAREEAANPGPPRPRDPFARELSPEWTGLSSEMPLDEEPPLDDDLADVAPAREARSDN